MRKNMHSRATEMTQHPVNHSLRDPMRGDLAGAHFQSLRSNFLPCYSSLPTTLCHLSFLLMPLCLHLYSLCLYLLPLNFTEFSYFFQYHCVQHSMLCRSHIRTWKLIQDPIFHGNLFECYVIQ